MKAPALFACLLLLAACEPQEASKESQATSRKLTEQGYQLLGKNQAGSSIAIFDKAIAADGKNIRAYQGKGIALDNMSKHDDAEEVYNKALKINPDAVNVKNNLAMSRILAGKYQEAADLLTPVASAEPGNATVQENLALANCLLGKRDEARKLYGKHLTPAEIEDNLRFCTKFEQLRKGPDKAPEAVKKPEAKASPAKQEWQAKKSGE